MQQTPEQDSQFAAEHSADVSREELAEVYAAALNGACQSSGVSVTEVTDETSRDEAISELMRSHHDDALGRFLAELAPDDDQEIRKKALSYGVDALLSLKGRE